MVKARITFSHNTWDKELRIVVDDSYVKDIRMEHYTPGEHIPACIEGESLVTQFVQAIMDAGYEAGMRPSKMQDNEPAIKEHLKDMREIAKHLLKMEN